MKDASQIQAPSSSPLSLTSLPPAVRQALQDQYRQMLAGHLARLAALADQGWNDLGAARTEVHRLAGAAGLMQDAALGLAAKQLEQHLRATELARAGQAWAELADRLRATLEKGPLSAACPRFAQLPPL